MTANRYDPALTMPLFSREGPQFYAAAYAHNAPFATQGTYQTPLSPAEEQAFRHWVAQNDVPFDPDAATVDYDMRGFWRSQITGGGDWGGGHFPDTYKTPYDTSFSAESQYATPDNPFSWHGDWLVDSRSGQVVFAPPPVSPPPNRLPTHPQPGIGGSRQ